jgi:hypothetical protein
MYDSPQSNRCSVSTASLRRGRKAFEVQAGVVFEAATNLNLRDAGADHLIFVDSQRAPGGSACSKS